MPQQPMNPMPPPYYYQPRKTRWWIPVLIIGIILVPIIIVIVTIGGLFQSVFNKEPVEVKPNTVLYLNLTKPVSEVSKSGLFALFSEGQTTSFYKIMLAVKKAKLDDRIKGIYINSGGAPMGFAMSRELLETLDDFKKSGKFIYAYIEMGSETDLLKAAAADKIFMPENGLFEFNGFGVSAMFMKGLFDKIGVEFIVDQHEDFKSAGETFNRKKFSDSARKNLKIIIDQRYNELLDNLVKYRKIAKKTLIDAMNRGIYSPDSLLALKLIDGLVNEPGVKDLIENKVFANVKSGKQDKKVRYISPGSYLESPSQTETKVDMNKQIAIIFAEGTMVSQGADNPFSGDNMINSKTFVKYLKKARENKNIKAIVLRINTGGGSVLSADEIATEIIKTKAVKPVYVSMGDVAASGGYFMAMVCDTIIAQPGTLTGSIGVISIVPNTNGLMNKLGISIDTISTGPSAQDLNLMLPFSQRQRNKLKDLSDVIYKRFVGNVAKNRHKTFEETRAIAKGRVWSGAEAKKIGLVDTLGGLSTAISIAKRRIGVSEFQKIRVKVFPEPKDEVTALLDLLKLSDKNDEDSELKLLVKYFNTTPDALKQYYNALPPMFRRQFVYLLGLINVSKNEPVMMAMPELIEMN